MTLTANPGATADSTATPRLALITGGSRGLGRSMALQLARAGVAVVLTWQQQQRAADAVVAEIAAAGGQAAALQLDVGQAQDFAAFAETLRELLRRRWGREQLDILINNAGHGYHAAFADTTPEAFDALVNVHLKAPFFLTQALLPMLADGARLLNVSSGLTRFSFPGYAAYAMMKGGVEVLTRYQARELGARGIRVNTLAPGAIETDFGGGAVRDNPGLNQALAAQTALGRVGQPDDIGGAVAALLSDGAGWISGQRIEVSGGMLL